MRVKWIIFDMMGVLFKDKDDVKACLIPFLREQQASESDEEIQERYIAASLGKLKSTEFWGSFRLPNLDGEYLTSKLKLDSQGLRIARKYKNHWQMGIISNDVSEWSQFLRTKHRINEIIDCSVISGDVGIRKPDKEIYNVFLQQTKALAQECIFIDDNLKNLLPAKVLGMNCILFDREKNIKIEDNKVDYKIDEWEQLVPVLSKYVTS